MTPNPSAIMRSSALVSGSAAAGIGLCVVGFTQGWDRLVQDRDFDGYLLCSIKTSEAGEDSPHLFVPTSAGASCNIAYLLAAARKSIRVGQ